jgi:esterase FrsA
MPANGTEPPGHPSQKHWSTPRDSQNRPIWQESASPRLARRALTPNRGRLRVQGDKGALALSAVVARTRTAPSRAHQIAYREQLRTYLAAAPGFPLAFERRVLDVKYHGGTTPVPVHIYRRPGSPAGTPVVLMLGGVDTWKMDIHQSILTASERMDVTVVAVDGPGVGESRVASEPDGDLILAGVAAQVRSLGNGRVGAAAWSFGATWAVKLALTGEVDASVAIGGPVEMAFDISTVRNWPNGMSGIMGNSLHRDTPFADADATAAGLAGFRLSSQGLLGGWGSSPTPLFVANGANDPYVPQTDTTLFQGPPEHRSPPRTRRHPLRPGKVGRGDPGRVRVAAPPAQLTHRDRPEPQRDPDGKKIARTAAAAGAAALFTSLAMTAAPARASCPPHRRRSLPRHARWRIRVGPSG